MQGEGHFLTQSHLCFKLKFLDENLDLVLPEINSGYKGVLYLLVKGKKGNDYMLTPL